MRRRTGCSGCSTPRGGTSTRCVMRSAGTWPLNWVIRGADCGRDRVPQERYSFCRRARQNTGTAGKITNCQVGCSLPTRYPRRQLGYSSTGSCMCPGLGPGPGPGARRRASPVHGVRDQAAAGAEDDRAGHRRRAAVQLVHRRRGIRRQRAAAGLAGAGQGRLRGGSVLRPSQPPGPARRSAPTSSPRRSRPAAGSNCPAGRPDITKCCCRTRQSRRCARTLLSRPRWPLQRTPRRPAARARNSRPRRRRTPPPGSMRPAASSGCPARCA